jgi:hypothetical protein
MASKYDEYWTAHLPEIGAGLRSAVSGTAAAVDAVGVLGLGDRQSWRGIAEVCGRDMTRHSMAHAAALGKIVAASGLCAAWPERIFRFTIGATGVLTITMADQPPGSRQVAANNVVGASAGTVPGPTAGAGSRGHSRGAGDSPADREADTDRLYVLLGELARRAGGPRMLRDCAAGQGWPRQGVYFFFEDSELRADGSGRVVRVGTHALTADSRTTLWDRLSQHRGHLEGRNPGGGNHRASVFRRHVGAALIRRGDGPPGLLASWLDRRHPGEWASREDDVERDVSGWIGGMPFLWLAVSGSANRGYIERNTIACLSGLAGGQDRSSAGWLGRDSVRSEVRESGLWNVQHVHDGYDPAFLQRLAALVQSTN